MYLTELQVRKLLHALNGLSAPGSRLAVNFGLGVEAIDSRRDTTLYTISLSLSGEHIAFRLAPDRATNVLTATGCPSKAPSPRPN